ncbi:hemerythrin HHE cation binding domain-containing protein [Mycena alexandri]|uniref:Hemerythrin HHE cation binding domain-containing protein n=1 Tax=Mycena alexandri TaxID=1745969 RepID=A0AAD6XBN9_9AGAR|nr:hemerythrin HHE cation binding domain-containing protein [Mycena alexandri]
MTDSQNIEERQWGRFSKDMAGAHAYFKQEFNAIYELADGSFAKRGLSLSLYLQTAQRLTSHLTMHHTIEERQIFPILAQRMPEFSTETNDAHIDSHKAIHEGLEEMTTLVNKFKKEPSTYSPDQMRTCLDGFRAVLFDHLDAEVHDLRAENLKKYWKLEELKEEFKDYL